MALETPEFISNDVNEIAEDMIFFYELATGKKIQPTDVERLLINAFAYREALLRSDINSAARQNLVDFSNFPILDYLGKLVGVNRLEAVKSQTTIEIYLQSPHPNLVIQSGTRFSNSDGSAVFATTEDLIVNNTTDQVTAVCESVNNGEQYNDFLSNSITTLVDVFPHFSSAANIDNSSGGSGEETDGQLRERIKIAPASFSVAGPTDAYKFYALSVNPSIIDVNVPKDPPIPGQVNVYILSDVVPTPQSILDAVKLKLSGEKVIPLTDYVVVSSAINVDYQILVNLHLFGDADDQIISSKVNSLLLVYTNDRKKKLGLDVVRNKIISLCMIDGVYNADLSNLLTDLTIAENEFANCTNISINILGYTNG